jgi:hypothetical protein
MASLINKREIIAAQVASQGGCRMPLLIAAMMQDGRMRTGDKSLVDITDLIEEMIVDGDLVEVIYFLPPELTDSEQPISFLLPKGTRVTSLDAILSKTAS